MSSASTPDDDSILDDFLEERGHDQTSWDRSYNKKQCPECAAIHDVDTTACSVCGWSP